MKKALIIFLVIIGVVFGALAALPYFFKAEILAAVKKEINNNINAKFELENVGVSVFTHFPNITLDMQNVSVSNIAPFEGDTLAKFDSFEITVSLSELISSKKIVLTDIELMRPVFNVIVDADGNANYDIAKASDEIVVEDTVAQSSGDDSGLSFALNHYGIYGANIRYTDIEGNMQAIVTNLIHEGSADFTLTQFDVDSQTEIEAVTVAMDGVAFLNKSRISLKAVLGIDLDKMVFAFKQNELKVNDLALAFDGNMSMPTDDIGFDMTFSAKNNDFKSLISLIPGVYLEGFESLKATGKFDLTGALTGAYSETTMPAIKAAVKIDNAQVQYPDLPSSLDKISADISFSTQGAADFDDAVVNVRDFHLELANNPINANLLLKTPISDPNIATEIFAKIDFKELKNALPLDGMEMAGLLDLNLKINTAMSTIEKEEFENVKADGEVSFKNFSLTGDSVPYPVSFELLTAKLSPQFLGFTVSSFKTTGIEANADGYFSNLLSFAMHDGTLKGEFNAIAEQINVDPFMEEDETASSEPSVAPVDQNVILDLNNDPLDFMRLPKNIQLDYTAECNSFLYDGAEFKDITANGYIANGVFYLSEAKTKLFDVAPVAAAGQFDTQAKQPLFGMKVGIQKMDIQKSVEVFETISKLFPIAKAAMGEINTNFDISGSIGDDLFPIMNSLNGAGKIFTKGVTINNFEAFNKAADKLNFRALKKQTLDDAKIGFELSDGNLFIKPFSTKIGAIDAKFVGRTGVDATIDYTVNLDIPTKMFPSEALKAVNGLASKASALLGKEVKMGDKVNIDLLFTNTITDVKVETKFNGSNGKSAVEDSKEKLKEELDKKKAEAEAKAREAVDKAKQDAQAAADEAKQKLEAEKKRLEEEARKKIEEEKAKAREAAKNKLKGAFGQPK
tara:strand:- start:123074 stop:125797 length:2724 start_codon:yes stop_codon:yes gene_type:complete